MHHILVTGSPSLLGPLVQSPFQKGYCVNDDLHLPEPDEHADKQHIAGDNSCEADKLMQNMEIFNKTSHLVILHHQLDTVHGPTLCLVNLFENIRQDPSKHIVVVLPDELMNSIAAKSLESTVVVYRSIYNLAAAVVYVPFADDLDTNSDESRKSNNTNDGINFVIGILEQTSVCEKYRLSSGNATKNIPEQTDSEASKAHLILNCTKSNRSSDECKDQKDVSEAHIDHLGVEKRGELHIYYLFHFQA